MLDNLKVMLGIDAEDKSLDAQLLLIVQMVTARLQILLGGIEVPEELQHIVLEVAIMRFNRIGSEGLSSHTVEGESLSFANSDFDSFSDEIQAFLDTQKDNTRGKVCFI